METLQPLLDFVREDEDILAVLLFGSHARGEADDESDIDVCLVLKPSHVKLRAGSRKKLEYLGRFEFDIQVFQQLPLYIRQRILREGVVLYVWDEDALYDIAIYTAREYEDFRPFYYEYLAEVQHAGS